MQTETHRHQIDEINVTLNTLWALKLIALCMRSLKQLNTENEAVLITKIQIQLFLNKQKRNTWLSKKKSIEVIKCSICFDTATLFLSWALNGLVWPIRSISQPYRIKVLLPFGIFYLSQSIKILVIPLIVKWKLTVQSNFPRSESCGWLSSIKKLLASLHWYSDLCLPKAPFPRFCFWQIFYRT